MSRHESGWRQKVALYPLSQSAPFLLILSVLSGCAEPQASPPQPRPVRFVTVKREEHNLVIQGSGQVMARYVSAVGFLISGRLVSRVVDVGSPVKAGDLIAKIDAIDYQNRLVAAQSQVVSAQASLDQAVPQEARQRKLLASGFTTQANYDNAFKALQSARAQLQGAEANLRLAQDQLRYTELHAPVDGVVTSTEADAGQVIGPGQSIVEISQDGERDAVFAVAAEHAENAKIGASVRVWLQSRPELSSAGTVREISPDADRVTGTYTVKVRLPDAPAEMRLGSVVLGQAEIKGEALIALPPTSILQSGESPQVWVISSDDTVHRKSVRVLRYEEDAVVIASGVNDGDRVVSAGVNALAEGEKVVVPGEAAKR
jgi:RND family efflux transporter MFP subunit